MNRYIIGSDDHEFIGRVYDLAGPVHHSFESFNELRRFPDCLYVINVDYRLSLLARRVESLNQVGSMLWAPNLPKDFVGFPVSRYEWCNIISDVYLTRFISISDCCLLLVNEVLECGVTPKKAKFHNLRRIINNPAIIMSLDRLQHRWTDLREERNLRVHSGVERDHSDDDVVFRTASMFELWGRGVRGEDRHGRDIDLQGYFESAINSLQIEFNERCEGLYGELAVLYDGLGPEFDRRFRQKYLSHDRSHPIHRGR